MIFLNIKYLFLLIIPAILLCLTFYNIFKKHKTINALFNHQIHDKVIPSYSLKRNIVQGSLLILAISSLVLSISDPAIIREDNKLITDNLNTIFVLDVSKSMNANDVEPNRLQNAKFFITDVLNDYKGLAGLVLFSGESVVQVPLTKDYELIKSNLSSIIPGYLEIQGSNLNSALRLSTEVFYNDTSVNVIILLTDGENHSDINNVILNDIINNNTLLFIVPIGTEKGSSIPEEGSFIKDSSGNNVISKLDMNILTELSMKTDGYIIKENDFSTLKNKLLSNKRYMYLNQEFSTILLKPYFLIISLLLLITNILVQFVRRKNV